MAKPINLNHARKARDRAKARAQADENAVKFGLTKSQKMAAKARDAQARTRLDGHRLSDPDKT